MLVERLWPQGMAKEHREIDLCVKEAGAGTDPLKWFGHDPERWEEFRQKYFLELSKKPEVTRQLADLVTFLFAVRDEEHNNTAARKMYLEKRGEKL